MPTIEHSTLAGAELHEPKGIGSATADQVYVADGAGSGAWTHWPFGWAQYQDNAAEQTFTSTFTSVSIDGLGSLSEDAYLPREIRGSGQLWNTTTDKITPIRAGDAYNIRSRLPVTTKTSAPTRLFWRINIDPAVPFIVAEGSLSLAKTPPFTETIEVTVFCLATFVSNGGLLQFATDTGSVGITKPDISLYRIHGGEF